MQEIDINQLYVVQINLFLRIIIALYFISQKPIRYKTLTNIICIPRKFGTMSGVY